jgi:hypothetical protein
MSGRLRGTSRPVTRPPRVVELGPSPPTALMRVLLRRRNRALVQVRMPLWKATLIAVVGLACFLGLTLAAMIGMGAVLHVLNPARHFDSYWVLHQQVVVGVLIGLSLLWLLPPHPWAKEVVEVPIRDDPAPRLAQSVTGEERVAVISVYRGRAPPVALRLL